MAMHDLLTGLPNRVLLNDRLQQALVAAKREDVQCALMFLDLDKFKLVNDTLGHDVGDQLLKQVAARMQACVRESDTVARIGGDEFIVLLRTVDDAPDAVSVAEKIRAALGHPFELAGQQLTISCSIGVALYPEHGHDGVELSKNADIAMYQAKDRGRDNVQLFKG
jgi:diguanylate cyclase (GGDEF)-like protein